jgi:uncharacterized RmlC-like cupin family protein
MKTAMTDLTTRIDHEGVCYKTTDFGEMNIAHVHLPAGADAGPLLEGMPQDLCPCPHWGYVVKGSIHVHYGDGREETVRAGDVYYWPPGHTVKVDEDFEAVEFSPSESMNQVLGHIAEKLHA